MLFHLMAFQEESLAFQERVSSTLSKETRFQESSVSIYLLLIVQLIAMVVTTS